MSRRAATTTTTTATTATTFRAAGGRDRGADSFSRTFSNFSNPNLRFVVPLRLRPLFDDLIRCRPTVCRSLVLALWLLGFGCARSAGLLVCTKRAAGQFVRSIKRRPRSLTMQKNSPSSSSQHRTLALSQSASQSVSRSRRYSRVGVRGKKYEQP